MISTLTSSFSSDVDKEVYEAIEYTIKGPEDVVDTVTKNRGCELMRCLIRKYDPQNPDLFFAMQGTLFGLADKKCADFNATVARIAFMDKLRKDMREQCGEEPEEHVWAGALAPAMDHTCLYQLATFRKEDDNLVNKRSYTDLKEYVRNRQARERPLVPMKYKKMDVSAFGNPWNGQEYAPPGEEGQTA